MSLFQCQPMQSQIRGQVRELIIAQNSQSCAISAPTLSPENDDTAARSTRGGCTTGTRVK